MSLRTLKGSSKQGSFSKMFKLNLNLYKKFPCNMFYPPSVLDKNYKWDLLRSSHYNPFDGNPMDHPWKDYFMVIRLKMN